MPIRGKVVRRVFEKAPKGDVYQGLVRKVRWGRTYEYKLILRVAWPEPDVLQRMLNEIMKSKIITPNYLAQKYNVKVSTAKRILEALREKGIIKLDEDASDASLKIYVRA